MYLLVLELEMYADNLQVLLSVYKLSTLIHVMHIVGATLYDRVSQPSV